MIEGHTAMNLRSINTFFCFVFYYDVLVTDTPLKIKLFFSSSSYMYMNGFRNTYDWLIW